MLKYELFAENSGLIRLFNDNNPSDIREIIKESGYSSIGLAARRARELFPESWAVGLSKENAERLRKCHMAVVATFFSFDGSKADLGKELDDLIAKNYETAGTVAAADPSALLPKDIDARVPDDDDFIMPDRIATIMLNSLDRGKNVLIVGPSGCGKSEMVKRLAKRQGKELYRLNLHSGTTDASLIGEKIITTDQDGRTITAFQYGILPKAMKEGAWLLLDEIDFCLPEYMATLQGVFEGSGTPLVIAENGGEVVRPAPGFRIVATANSLGRGEGSGKGYHGTNNMNIATLDRWTILQMDYTSKEKSLIMSRLKVKNKREISKLMISLSKRIRQSIGTGELGNFVFSTRRLLCWADSISALGFGLATEAEILGRLTETERDIIAEYISDIFNVKL